MSMCGVASAHLSLLVHMHAGAKQASTALSGCVSQPLRSLNCLDALLMSSLDPTILCSCPVKVLREVCLFTAFVA